MTAWFRVGQKKTSCASINSTLSLCFLGLLNCYQNESASFSSCWSPVAFRSSSCPGLQALRGCGSSPRRPAGILVVRWSSGCCGGVCSPAAGGCFGLGRARSPSLNKRANASHQLAAVHSPYVGTSMRDIFQNAVLRSLSPPVLCRLRPSAPHTISAAKKKINPLPKFRLEKNNNLLGACSRLVHPRELLTRWLCCLQPPRCIVGR